MVCSKCGREGKERSVQGTGVQEGMFRVRKSVTFQCDQSFRKYKMFIFVCILAGRTYLCFVRYNLVNFVLSDMSDESGIIDNRLLCSWVYIYIHMLIPTYLMYLARIELYKACRRHTKNGCVKSIIHIHFTHHTKIKLQSMPWNSNLHNKQIFILILLKYKGGKP